MRPAYYTFGIFFLGLSVACGVLQSIIHFQVGNGIYYLQTFAHWFLGVNIISIIAALFVVNYLRIRQYKLAFRTGVIATGLLVCQIAFNYIILIFVLREMRGYGMLLLIPYLIASISFAATLIFTNAGERPWIKTAGVFMLICYTLLASVFVAGLLSPPFFATETFTQIERWTSRAVNLVPVFFIMNFRSELQSSAVVDQPVDRQTPSDTVFGALAMVALLSALTLGLHVAKESYWNVDWQKKAPEKNKELVKDFETRMYVRSRGDTLHYLFRKPLGYDPQKKYPIVVCLHGGPVRERKIEVAEPAPFLSEPENQKKYPAFIFVPQGPPGHTWGGMPGLPSVDSLVFETIASLEEEFPVDETRRYVAGASMGGYGAWYFIGVHSEMFAAAMPFCGAGNIDLAGNMVEIPVWAFHGGADRKVPVSASRDMIEAIRKAGGNPRYTEFADTGHNVWPDVSKTPGLLDWLFAQKRR
jgi:hypothetical protein